MVDDVMTLKIHRTLIGNCNAIKTNDIIIKIDIPLKFKLNHKFKIRKLYICKELCKIIFINNYHYLTNDFFNCGIVGVTKGFQCKIFIGISPFRTIDRSESSGTNFLKVTK